jgi:hypothetical protein
MNAKRLLLAILVTFITIWVTSFLIHGVWMNPVYKATMNLWRSEEEMTARMGWMLAGQLIAALAFVLIWAKGFAQGATMKCAAIYGLLMGLFAQSYTFIMYCVQPLTQEIVWKWFVGGAIQGIIIGVVTALIYKPASPASQTRAPSM